MVILEASNKAEQNTAELKCLTNLLWMLGAYGAVLSNYLELLAKYSAL